jgi:hypothetical protein
MNILSGTLLLIALIVSVAGCHEGEAIVTINLDS